MRVNKEEIEERIKQLEDSLEFLYQSSASGIGPIKESYEKELRELKQLLWLREDKDDSNKTM